MNQHNQAEVFKMLEKAGAVYLDQHFVYKSGKHGPGYIDMDRVYPNIQTMWRLTSLMVQPFVNNRAIKVVAGPAVGGVALASDVAHRMRQAACSVDRVWADKVGDDFAFERAGFADKLDGKGVLVVEDLLTTGGSVAKVCAQVEAAGGEVIAVSAICNRGGLTSETLGWELHALCQVDFEAVNREDCELCKHAGPIVTNIGHGSKFHYVHTDYPGGFIEL